MFLKVCLLTWLSGQHLKIHLFISELTFWKWMRSSLVKTKWTLCGSMRSLRWSKWSWCKNTDISGGQKRVLTKKRFIIRSRENHCLCLREQIHQVGWRLICVTSTEVVADGVVVHTADSCAGGVGSVSTRWRREWSFGSLNTLEMSFMCPFICRKTNWGPLGVHDCLFVDFDWSSLWCYVRYKDLPVLDVYEKVTFEWSLRFTNKTTKRVHFYARFLENASVFEVYEWLNLSLLPSLYDRFIEDKIVNVK